MAGARKHGEEDLFQPLLGQPGRGRPQRNSRDDRAEQELSVAGSEGVQESWVYCDSEIVEIRPDLDAREIAARLVQVEEKLDRILQILERPKRKVKRTAPDYSREFEDIWTLYPKRAGSNPKNKAWSAFKQRLSGDVTWQDIQAGVMRYKRFCETTGKVGTEMVMQASRFFGPGYEFENAWDVPRETSAPKTEEDWLALGKEKGMEPKTGESWHEFRQRLKGAM